jgi:hypothetical protein
MVFNGHTEQYVESLDEELFTEIQVMYTDGLLGNKGIFEALTPVTTAVFNYMRNPKSPAIRVTDVFPWIVEYSTNPDDDTSPEQAASNGLLGFASQAKGFRVDRFKNAKLHS